MSYGGYTFNKVQLGRESTAGTAVAATTIWRGEFASLKDERTRVIVEEQVGQLTPAERSYDSAYLGRLTQPATPMTFEQLPHLFEAGIETVTPTDNTGNYTYGPYAFPTGTTLNTIKTYTIEAFNNIADADAREMPYSFVEQIDLAANAGEAWTMAGTWVGRKIDTSTPTSLSTLVAVQEALLPRTTLFIDATGGTIGSTQKTGVLMGATLSIRTGIIPVMVGDGNLYFSTVKFTRPEITFSLTLELEEVGGVSVVNAERVIYESDAIRLFRLNIAGSDANRSIVFDFAGKYDSVDDYQNADGNTTVKFNGHAVNSATDSLFFEASVTNLLSALP